MKVVDFADEDTQVQTEPRDVWPKDPVYEVIWAELQGQMVLRVTPLQRADLRG
jgi:hypothetical protein